MAVKVLQMHWTEVGVLLGGGGGRDIGGANGASMATSSR